MADDTECAESERETVNEEEKGLDSNDTIDEAGKELLREYGMFFDKFGKIV